MDILNDFEETSATITVSHPRFNDSVRTIQPLPPMYYNRQFACFAGPDATGGYTGPPIYGEYACGGCGLPLPWSLNASALGEQVTLTCQMKQDPNYPTQATGSGYWTGRFTKSIPSRTCGTKLDGSDSYWQTGDVEFYVIFQGGVQGGPGIGVRPSYAVYYRHDGNGRPLQCSSGGSTPNNAPGVWNGIGTNAPGYNPPTYGWSCDPFMAYGTGTWYWSATWRGVDYGPYTFGVDFSVSE